MITKKLKQLVKQEADNIKIHATEEEIGRLDFDILDCFSVHECIYGEMTGHCFNERAIELLRKCSRPFSSSIETLREYDLVYFQYGHDTRAYSAIEFYISRPNAKNKELIAYIKGETKTLRL